jgi:lambda family phage portal protein
MIATDTTISLPMWAGTTTPAPQSKTVRAVQYDIARTTPQNRQHFAGADTASATASLSFHARDLARRRARYEVHNSSVLRGIIETISEDVIGTGPRLQILTTSPNQRAAARRLELLWTRWAQATKLNEKLRCAVKAWKVDGEAFLLLTTNQQLRGPIKLDVRLIESDQIEHPQNFDESPTKQSGLEFDEAGNVIAYNMLTWHPGDKFWGANPLDSRRVPANRMLHLFRMDRPGQVRGFSEIASAVTLMAARRRYTNATVLAAETVANIAGVVQTDTPPNGTENAEPGDTWELPSGQVITMPGGWKFEQIDAKQPTSTHNDFTRGLLMEGARCVLMPGLHATGDASSYNYSSARFADLLYRRHVNVERSRVNEMLLMSLFDEFMREAILIEELWGTRPTQIDPEFRTTFVPYRWGWDTPQTLDPLKEAQAATERLRNGTALLSDEIDGTRDIDDHLTEMKVQSDRIAETGFMPSWMVPPYANAAAPTGDGNTGDVNQ